MELMRAGRQSSATGAAQTRTKQQCDKRETRRAVRQLHAAVTTNNGAAVRSLLLAVADIDFHYNTVTALQIAVMGGYADICKTLIKWGSDVDQTNVDGDTLLNLAAWRGHEGVIRILLGAGADPDRSNNRGSTPLNTAAYRGFADVAQTLVDGTCMVNRPNIWGQSPLICAAGEGHVELVRVLIGADCDLNWTDNERRTALVLAAQKGHADVVKLLILAGSDLNTSDRYGCTALYFAAKYGFVDIASQLIEAGADLNRRNTKGFTPLTQAVSSLQMDIVELLIRSGCDVNTADYESSQTAIHMAVRMVSHVYGARELHMRLVHLLLKARCDVNVCDKHGWTPLYQATRGGETAVQLAHVSAECRLSIRISNDYSDITHTLAYPGLAEAKHSSKGHVTIINSAVILNIVRRLLECGADVSRVTNTADTMLHGSVFGNKPEITDMLIKAGCDVNEVNSKNQLPLYMAIDHRAENEVATTSHSQYVRSRRPMTLKIIDLLLKAGSRTDVCELKTHQSALFVAVQQQYVEAVDLLIAAGCDVNLPNCDGDTPLWVACTKGNEEIVRILLRHPDIELDRGVSHVPLHAAAVLGSCPVAELLINAGSDVNKLSNTGVSALFLSAEMDHLGVAQVLVRNGANPSFPHRFKGRCCIAYTDAHPHLELEPLFAAIQNDNLLMVKLILTASPRMPYSALATLRDILFRTGYAREARLSLRAIAQYAQFFVGILSQPRSLREECRGCIREALGNRPHLKIHDIPLPDLMKDYVLLRDEPILYVQ